MKNKIVCWFAFALFALLPPGHAQDASITVHAGQTLHPLSPYLTGACLEDVNHEVYGGIYSQMIFGESFQEPASISGLKNFTVYGGRWVVSGDSLEATGGDGAKIVATTEALDDGEVSVELLFPENSAGNAGLIAKVSKPGNGPDDLNGYEISLEPSGNLVLGRHRRNWEPIQRVPCAVLVNDWNKLTVRFVGREIEVLLNGKSITRYEDSEHPLAAGFVGLRTWQTDARFRNFSVSTNGQVKNLAFEQASKDNWGEGVSGMWHALRHGSASGGFSCDPINSFSGSQSQTITFTGGSGEIGIENQGLNRWGLNFVAGKRYEGCLWARASKPTEAFVSFESRDGTVVYAEQGIRIAGNDWERIDFSLKPSAADNAGRFAIKLKQPGTVTVGYAFVEPGPWGRFKGLPVRRDVGEGLVNQGITVLRYGGSMVNHPEYRWKKMIGPRDRRAPYRGTWYAYSSNGWGIFDFLNFCEAAGFLGVPDLNANETPRDMADFVEYANGPSNSEWGKRRAADGHPKSYHLKYMEIGNEERVDDGYYNKFKPVAEAIWAKDPEMILIVGDFAYSRPIKNPFNLTGAASGITTLAAQQKILQLAKQHDREVWFDVHTLTDGPRPNFGGALTYIDALDQIADGAKHRVVTFEFNANNHQHRRGLGNAAAINQLERDGRMPIATSANCLQPDGQNDNGWNQGLLFLNPSRVWLQSPGYVTGMVSRNHQPFEVKSDVQSPGNSLDVSAKRSEDGRILVVQVVNFSNQALATAIHLDEFNPAQTTADLEELAGPLNAVNTAADTGRITRVAKKLRLDAHGGDINYTFPANAFTVIKFR